MVELTILEVDYISLCSEEKAKLLRTVVAKAEEKDAELELVTIVTHHCHQVTVIRQYLGGLNISEVRKAQQFKPLVPSEPQSDKYSSFNINHL